MLFKRSTRSIVTGKRPRTQQDNVPDVQDNQKAPESPVCRQYWKENVTMNQIKVPRWAVWSVLGAALAVLAILLAVLLINMTGQTENTQAPALPVPSEAQRIIAVEAAEALREHTSPGDVVRLYGPDGQPVPELQYIQVYQSAADTGLLLLMDDRQAAALVGQGSFPMVALVVHNDPERAAVLLELQERINAPVISLTVQTEVLMTPGEALELSWQASIDPTEAQLPQIQWVSSDPAVAVVEGGRVTALGVGQSTITASCGDATASCEVTVEVPLSGIILNKTDAALAVGDTMRLTATAEPSDATHFAVAWSVADPAVATVAEDGTISGVAPGITVVTAASGDISATCTVTVGYHAEVVQLDQQSLTLATGQTGKLNSTVYPSSGVIDAGSYETSNAAIATVAEDGTVTAVAPGTAEITFRCGEATASCTVVVADPPEAVQGN